MYIFFFSSRRRHTRGALVTGVQTCALPIYRGIGLEFVRSFAGDGWRVHACARNIERAQELRAVAGDVVHHRLDVADGLKAAGLARTLADEAIDVLINNAGVYGPRSGFGATDYDAWAEVLQVNTLAPLRMVERFAGLIEKSAHTTVINIPSRMGSIGVKTSGGDYIYRSSKAEERREGKECVRQCRSRWSPYH